jgi:hypothetical protein
VLQERARIERVESGTAPPPAAKEQGDRDQRNARERLGRERARGRGEHRERENGDGASAHGVRGRQAETR